MPDPHHAAADTATEGAPFHPLHEPTAQLDSATLSTPRPPLQDAVPPSSINIAASLPPLVALRESILAILSPSHRETLQSDAAVGTPRIASHGPTYSELSEAHKPGLRATPRHLDSADHLPLTFAVAAALGDRSVTARHTRGSIGAATGSDPVLCMTVLQRCADGDPVVRGSALAALWGLCAGKRRSDGERGQVGGRRRADSGGVVEEERGGRRLDRREVGARAATAEIDTCDAIVRAWVPALREIACVSGTDSGMSILPVESVLEGVPVGTKLPASSPHAFPHESPHTAPRAIEGSPELWRSAVRRERVSAPRKNEGIAHAVSAEDWLHAAAGVLLGALEKALEEGDDGDGTMGGGSGCGEGEGGRRGKGEGGGMDRDVERLIDAIDHGRVEMERGGEVGVFGATAVVVDALRGLRMAR